MQEYKGSQNNAQIVPTTKILKLTNKKQDEEKYPKNKSLHRSNS